MKRFAWNVFMVLAIIYSFSLPYSGITVMLFIIWFLTHDLFDH